MKLSSYIIYRWWIAAAITLLLMVFSGVTYGFASVKAMMLSAHVYHSECHADRYVVAFSADSRLECNVCSV